MWIQIYFSVTALILIQKSASEAGSLPSPANVSIQCDSYGVEVRWEYPDLDQSVSFKVKVKDEFSESNWTRTQSLQLNISSMLLMAAYNRYYVTVMAVRGEEESHSTGSAQFSYNLYASADKKCYLDFPEIELSPKDGKLHVQFTNPLQLYRNSPALRDLTDYLKYCIKTEEEREVCETCIIKQSTCETSVVFSEHRGEYCINLTGNVGQRGFSLRRSCFRGDIRSYPPVTVYLYPVLGVVLTLLFITVAIVLLVKKCHTEMKKKVSFMFGNFLVFDTPPSQPTTTLSVVPDKVEPDLQIEQPKTDTDSEEQTTLIPLSDPEDIESHNSEVNRSYGPNDLVDDEQSDLSDFYDCPHAPRKK